MPQAGGSGAAERIKHDAARLAPGLYALGWQLDGEGGEVRAPERTSADGSPITRVAAIGMPAVAQVGAVAQYADDLPRVRSVLSADDYRLA